MTNIALSALLAVMAACAWLGCLGFARLRAPLDRLHCVAFVTATSGTALAAAAFVADGVSPRALKMVVILLALLIGGAVQSHAVARAIDYRAAHPREPEA